MTIRKILCELLCDQDPCPELPCPDMPYPQQESISRIIASDIVALFDEQIEDDVDVNVSDLHITDRTFKLVDIPHLREFLLGNPVSERKYAKERHDCDDFAYILQGDVTRWDSDLAFGIIHGRDENGNSHAWNVCIGTDHKIYFVEPQNDRVWKAEGEWKIWLVVM